jgi:hypothetical protein
MCPKHPKYKAIREPRCECHICWEIWWDEYPGKTQDVLVAPWEFLSQDPIDGSPISVFELHAYGMGNLTFYLKNKDGSRKWKHTIRTEEI